MLGRLHIENFALIRSLDIDFKQGLQVITGETGAGKSILLGALRLLMGVRADQKNISDPEKKSIVEAVFHVSPNLKDVFEAHEVDFDEETIIRREIAPNGKSRAFINDSPVTLEQLKLISTHLLDIHSQFETSQLFTEEFQMALLDSMCGHREVLNEYAISLSEWQTAQKELKNLQEKKAKWTAESDYKNFLLQELLEAGLDQINEEELTRELDTQTHAEQLSEHLAIAVQKFSTEELGLSASITEVRNRIRKMAEYSAEFLELEQRAESLWIELHDMERELLDKTEHLQVDPQRLEELLHIQNTLQKLYAKHQVHTVDELKSIATNLQGETEQFIELDEQIESKAQEIIQLEKQLNTLAEQLSEQRKNNIPAFNKNLEETFKRLGLEKARFGVELTDSDTFLSNGKEHIRFMFQANAGYDLLPISAAISGGERSRVMLAIKKMMADFAALPTLILDEIDTGVSGRIADEIGKVMREMAEQRQLIVITHQPQVAAKGSHHFKVTKSELEAVTVSHITELSLQERKEEIAQLISGTLLTEAALQQAEELMR